MTENPSELNKKENLEKVKKTLLNKSSYIMDLNKKFEVNISNGGDFYAVWYATAAGSVRYGEAKLKGTELVLYKDWYGNDHEIEQIEIERINLT